MEDPFGGWDWSHQQCSDHVDQDSDALLHGDFFSWSIIFMVCVSLVLGLRMANLFREGAIIGYRTRKDLFITAGGAIFAAAAGYVLAFRPDDYPPVLNLGRLSGFNAPASIGVCLLIACAISFACGPEESSVA